jgi:hypothetical protein
MSGDSVEDPKENPLVPDQRSCSLKIMVAETPYMRSIQKKARILNPGSLLQGVRVIYKD